VFHWKIPSDFIKGETFLKDKHISTEKKKDKKSQNTILSKCFQDISVQAGFLGKCPSTNQAVKGPQVVDLPPTADTLTGRLLRSSSWPLWFIFPEKS